MISSAPCHQQVVTYFYPHDHVTLESLIWSAWPEWIVGKYTRWTRKMPESTICDHVPSGIMHIFSEQRGTRLPRQIPNSRFAHYFALSSPLFASAASASSFLFRISAFFAYMPSNSSDLYGFQSVLRSKNRCPWIVSWCSVVTLAKCMTV